MELDLRCPGASRSWWAPCCPPRRSGCCSTWWRWRSSPRRCWRTSGRWEARPRRCGPSGRLGPGGERRRDARGVGSGSSPARSELTRAGGPAARTADIGRFVRECGSDAWHSAALRPVFGWAFPLSPSFLCPLPCLLDPDPLFFWAVYPNTLFRMHFLGPLIDLGCTARGQASRGEEEQKREPERPCDCAGVRTLEEGGAVITEDLVGIWVWF